MVNEISIAVSERREAYLRCVCAALNFDVGEIWSWRDDESTQKGGRGDNDSGSSSGSSSMMRFIQLYTSPSFRNQRSKLVTPSEDWEQSKGDVSKHKFSPLICEAVRDGGAVVWANTAVEGGLLGRSDLPLRTAVGAPVCTQSGDLCVLVLFSPTIIEKSPEAMDFLFTLAQVASETTNAFLPASNPSFVQHITFPSFWRDTQASQQRLKAIRESLPRGVIFDTDTLAMGPFGHPERSLLEVRSVYNDPASGGSVIPIELLSNRGGGGKAGILSSVVSGGMGVFGPGALTTTDNRSVKAAESGGDGGGSSTPKRRASFQSNAPIDLSLSSFVAPDEGTELEDYNLWVAFMETETPLGSPSSASIAAASGQDIGEGGGSGSNEDVCLKHRRRLSSQPASFQSLSALLSTSTSVASFASLSSDDENDNSSNDNGDVGLSVFASPVSLKQELVDEPAGANGEHVDSQQFGVSGAEAAVDGNGVSSDAGSCPSNEMVVSSLMTSREQRGMVWNEQKWTRFNEFIGGMLSVSPFQAADVWLPVAQGAEDAETKASRLFLFNSNIQSQDSRLSKWSEVSRNVVLASGVGLPGLVFQERRPQWAVDYSKVDSSRNPLASIARMLGIGSAFGVPLPLDDNDECGVVMLYSTSCLPPSELMVEVVERATWLLLADAPVPNALRQRCRDKELSAKDIGRIAGAYKHHALWDQQKNQNGNINNSSGSGNNKRRAEVSSTPKPPDDPAPSSESASQSESGTGGWAGMESAFAAAAAAAASGGQGGGFRADGGAVAFIPPRGWSSIENPPPELVFDRVDLDGRSSFMDDNEVAKTAVEAVEAPSSPSPTCPAQTPTPTRQPHQSEPKRKPQLSVTVSSALRLKPTSTPARRPRNAADERACAIGAAAKRPRVRRDADNGEGKGTAASASPTSAVTSKAAASNGVVSAPSTGKGKAGAKKGGVAGSVTPAMKSLNKEASVMPEEEEEGGPTGKSSGGRMGSRKTVVAPVEGGEEFISPGGNVDALSNSTGMSKCRSQGCDKIPNARTPFCWDHWSAARQCQHPGCEKLSQGNTRLCIAHGGGRRCTHPGCNKGARDRFFCAAHGGGKRCSMAGCGKAAVGGSDLCTAHGGGKRCQVPDCPKSAQSKTNFCVRHGGGRKCAVEGCAKVARGRTSHCAAHGGGIRCCVEGCNKAAVGRERMCRSHQRKHKAGLTVGTSSTVDRARQAALASPSRASTDSSSTALSVLSAAAETHGSTDFLESISLSPQPPPQPFTARANGSSGFLRWGGVEAGVTAGGNGSGGAGGGGAQSIFSQAILGESGAVSRNKHSLSMVNGSVSGPDSIEGAMFGGGGGGGKRVRRLASPVLHGSSS